LAFRRIGQQGKEQHKQYPNRDNPAEWRIRLPTEQEWQRAALSDTGWCYPWGDKLDETRGNYAEHIGQPTSVEKYPDGKSLYGVLDMIGDVWEWSLTGWGQETIDVSGYTYRIIKGGAWNISNPDYLRANDRGCHPPRGRLNDCGFRCGYFFR
jgi:formylglycine-generating enzyme required for sulfatase activity